MPVSRGSRATWTRSADPLFTMRAAASWALPIELLPFVGRAPGLDAALLARGLPLLRLLRLLRRLLALLRLRGLRLVLRPLLGELRVRLRLALRVAGLLLGEARVGAPLLAGRLSLGRLVGHRGRLRLAAEADLLLPHGRLALGGLRLPRIHGSMLPRPSGRRPPEWRRRRTRARPPSRRGRAARRAARPCSSASARGLA